MNNQNESFFRPVLSTLGLIISFVTAIAPFFTLSSLDTYFIDSSLSKPSSAVSVIFGIVITWVVLNFYPYFELRLGKKKDSQFEPRIRLGPTSTIWTFLLIEFILFIAFFTSYQYLNNSYAIIQAIEYVLFFDVLIFIFALLVSMTNSRYQYIAEKNQIAEKIYSTLEKNKIISPGISIYSNEILSNEEKNELHIQDFMPLKRVRIQTVVQEKEDVVAILSTDYSELIKVVRKNKIEK